MTSNLDALMHKTSAAQQNAQTTMANVGTPANVPAPQVAPVPPMPAPSFDAISGGNKLNVSTFLKVSDNSFQIGKDKDPKTGKAPRPIQEAIVKMPPRSEGMFPCTQVRWGKQPVHYDKTYDGEVAVSGGPWATAYQNALTNGGDAYATVDILMEVVEAEGYEPGLQFGYTPPKSGVRSLKALIDARTAAGLNDVPILVKITHEGISKNGNNWGVINYEFLGAAEAVQEAAE